MSGLMRVDKGYAKWIQELKNRYRRSQIKASVAINAEVQKFYWHLGQDIVVRDAENAYGTRFYKSLSKDLLAAIPDAKGFSPANLRYMRRFYELFPMGDESLPQLAETASSNDDEKIVPQAAEQSSLAKPKQMSETLFSIP